MGLSGRTGDRQLLDSSDRCCALPPNEQVCGFLLKLLCVCDHTQHASLSSRDARSPLCLLSVLFSSNWSEHGQWLWVDGQVSD